jgi:hypothetical protein
MQKSNNKPQVPERPIIAPSRSPLKAGPGPTKGAMNSADTMISVPKNRATKSLRIPVASSIASPIAASVKTITQSLNDNAAEYIGFGEIGHEMTATIAKMRGHFNGPTNKRRK